MDHPVIVIRRGREKSLKRFHPWVFSGSVFREEGEPKPGDLVQLVDEKRNLLGLGHYNKGSITIKVLAFEEATIDARWFEERIRMALELRKRLGFPSSQTNAYRLVHGEGDGLPGLIIDVYGQCAVIQCHSAGMEREVPVITETLVKLGMEAVIRKPLGHQPSEVLHGEVSERTEVLENGMSFHVDVLNGQKTGFFLDQRDNRDLLRRYTDGKSILNVFSYTGGFSISALEGGATSAISLDASAAVLELADENAQLNGFADKHRSLKADAVPYLENMQDTFDVIVLDPPAFAKHRSARHNAIQAYRRINEAALKCLNPGGMLFTFSCSQVIDRQLFYDTVASASINSGKRVQVLHHLRQPADHPVSMYHPEGEYLKGLVLRTN